MKQEKEDILIAAVGDIHCSRACEGKLRGFFQKIRDEADVLLLCGDLTDYGKPEEAEVLVGELAPVFSIPVLAVLGNHDYESGREDEVRTVLSRAGVQVLDGTSCEIEGVGFAGVKGFAGGFGNRELQPWGEKTIKDFVDEAVKEALKLESALQRLGDMEKIAILHYAPIPGTVQGEPAEIMPFLGSSRLEEALNRYRVAAAFHGHAHYGSPEGHTGKGIPVFNVAMAVLKRTFGHEREPVRFFKVKRSRAAV